MGAQKYGYKHLLRLTNMVVIWKATLHVLSCCVIFIHGHVPTWIKDSSLFNNLLSLREMFLSAPHSLATPALKRPPVCLHVHNTPSPRQSCHGRSWLCDDDSFIKEPHLITLKSGHMDTQEERAAVEQPSHLSPTSHHKPLFSPHGSPFTWTGFQSLQASSAHNKEICIHLVCHSRPNKPVYVLNTAGTLDIPDRHRHRRVITAITAPY